FLLTMKHTRTSLILAGLFACLAFLTRYNAVFLYPAGIFSIILVDWRSRGGKTALKNSGIFLGSSVLFGLPWYIPNMIVRGSPVYNTNIIVLKLNYYGEQLEKVDAIKSVTDLILLDPFYFFRKTLGNIGNYLWRDFHELMDLRFSVFVLAGFILLVVLLSTKRIRFSGKQWAFFVFPVLHFTVLGFAHYNIRFSFLRLPFYASLLFIPLIYAVKKYIVENRKLSTGIFVFALVLVLVKFYPGYLKIRAQHENKPDPEFILDFAAFIKSYNVDESFGVISRKPHISHYSGLRLVMLPNNLKTLGELHAYAKKEKAKFLLMSYVEYATRPYFRFLLDNIREYPGFTPVMRSEGGVIYLIDVQ
ncbi:MAG: hypothetical protein HOC71_16010, partial [Candidatus Latescibacteria bacterium]|nr:hypothetical protein [Candidatus Latescibacterota bacterium]